MFGYIDNGNLPNAPSWFLRNILLCLTVSFNLNASKLQVMAVRNLVDNLKDSIIFDLCINIDGDVESLLNTDNIRCVGWERNSDNKLLPKKANSSKMFDPVALS